MTELAPGEISTGDAARLLNVSTEMIRRAVNAGHIARQRRGVMLLSDLVAGYAEFLRSSAGRTDANETQSRAHRARAAKIERTTARRRASLVDRAEVETVLTQTTAIATARLRAVDMTGLIDGATVKVFREEIAAACTRIEAARDRAIAELRGGIEGDDDGR